MATVPRVPVRRSDRAALEALFRTRPGVRSVVSGGGVAGKTRIKLITQRQQTALARVVAQAPNLEGAFDAVLTQEGRFAVGEIKGIWPVDTGLSREAWRLERTAPLSYVIANPVEYAQYVHYAGVPARLVDTIVPDIIKRARERIRKRMQAIFARVGSELAASRRAQAAAIGRGTTTGGGTIGRLRRFLGF